MTTHDTGPERSPLGRAGPEAGRSAAHSLIAALAENLPWAQQLGTPAAQAQQHSVTTALRRAERHLATSAAASAELRELAQILARRDQLRAHYESLTAAPTLNRDRAADRTRSRDYGLEL